MQNTLDLSIKMSETGTVDGGYTAKNDKCYPCYMDNDAWNAFKTTMQTCYPVAFSEYGAGSGGEMKESSFPPKMASYGSSSRMIFCLCRDVPRFHFEYKLPTKVGGIANLDGFLETDDRFVFVEAKCREPYGVKSPLIDWKYEDLYRYIDTDVSCNLNIKIEDAGAKMKVLFSVNEESISIFDMKQMICHLLGIAVKLLQEPTDKTITFIYLCFNPKRIVILDERKKAEITAVYETMCAAFARVDFKSLFATITEYVRTTYHVGRATDRDVAIMLANFECTLCDQTDFKRW